MPQQPRILSRDETLLRLPSGSSNLAANPDQWHSLTPRFEDERFEISSLAFTIAGPQLLQSLESFAGSAGTLELAIDGFDGYGSLRDLASLVPQVLNSGLDWNAGNHLLTFADAEAGQARDGSQRVGLRGLPVRGPAPAQQPAWTSSVLHFRYGRALTAVSWDCWTLRDPAGATVAPPTIELRTGTRTPPGLITWAAPFQAVASTSAEIDRGYANLPAAANGNVYQLRVLLPYAEPGSAVTPADSLLYTAVVFALCVWIELDAPRWRFSSLAQMIDRSELTRHLAAAAWNAADDVALLRVPLNFALRGRFAETIRARLSPGTGLSLVEVAPVTDLRFEAQR